MKKSFLLVVFPCALGVQMARASALLKPTSGVTQALSAKSLRIDSKLRGAFAQTTVTTIYSNPNNDRIEADFLYSAPEGSVVTGFAYWYGNEKVVARVVEKARAAKIYQYITSRMRDPALVEMVGPNKFRARIFPIEARADLKIEVQLAQKLGATSNSQAWKWPLREETRDGALENVEVNLQSDRPFRSNLGAVTNSTLHFTRTNFQATGDATALVPQTGGPLRASLVAARSGGPDGFFSLALTSNTPVALPHLRISGISTYDVQAPKTQRLRAGENLIVTGRYRGSGTATLFLNGQSVQVQFPNTRENNNLASLLWASGRIEALSGQAKNKAQVMALSQRFGLPSLWTSWLAIPSEERSNFRRQMWASDRANAAKAYAQAVARGDGRDMRAQKAVFNGLTHKLQADGSNYAENEELQPLSSYLNDELRSLGRAKIEAKYDSHISAAQKAKWARWEKNLKRAGARAGGKGVDLPVYVVEDELRIASRLYLQEVEAGRKGGAMARKYQARLKELAKTKTAKEYEWDETSFIQEQAEMRANALGMEIMAERSKSHPDKIHEQQARTRLARLDDAQLVNAEATLSQLKTEQVNQLAGRLATEVRGKRENGQVARDLQNQLLKDSPNGSLSFVSSSLQEAWEGRAHEAAYRLLQMQKEQPQNTSDIAALQSELDKSIQKFGGNRSEVLQAEQERLDSKQPLVAANDYHYRVRPGDPLISVLAPANCRQVVAQMPDGTLLPLSFNASTGAWEAHFDVSTTALDGDYRVQIFIVAADGTKKSLTMNFSVDSHAPQGSGSVRIEGKVWHLSLQSDKYTVRASAFLPWDERAELRRNPDHTFTADVPVPDEFAGTNTQVRFVLTDAAHNRTEVSVDMSK